MENSEQPVAPWNSNRPWNDESANGFSGLTKREYFAGLAMQGMLAKRQEGWVQERLISTSIELADELLKQLNHKN